MHPSRLALSVLKPARAVLGLITAVLSSACSSDPPSQSNTSSGGTSGSASGGSSSGSGGRSGAVRLVPDDTGWVDAMGPDNTVGVQGAWYPYGDKYGVAKCTNVGQHEPDECSTIFTPDPLVSGFPNEDGVMCTTGETAVVLACLPGVPNCAEGTPDYSNMWGAGIGLDLNAEGATDAGPGAKRPYDPDAYGVVGVAFEIDELPLPKLRVEFPIELPDGTTTEDHPDGSPYWNADSTYPPSPVNVGQNEFRWADVRAPRTSYVFERSKILAIQFHVPAITTGTERGAYSFCIKNLEFLTE